MSAHNVHPTRTYRIPHGAVRCSADNQTMRYNLADLIVSITATLSRLALRVAKPDDRAQIRQELRYIAERLR